MDNKILSRIDKLSIPIPESGCYIWLGGIAGAGYPVLKIGSLTNGTRRQALVHRLIYELFFDKIPVGYDISHKCHTKLCVRPEHLEAITHRENCKKRPIQAGANHRYNRGFPEWLV